MGALPDGIYRLSLDDETRLTSTDEKTVTLLPAQHDARQEFAVRCTSGDNYSIAKPSPYWPLPFVCHDGDPKEGARVILRVSDFPPNEWKITQGAGPKTFTIVAAGGGPSLTIGPGRIPIFPPILELTSSSNGDHSWIFEFVRES
ncbi:MULTISPECIES: hypothetical protein [Streptomyces]|uniref:hypothetical protein n=1 Tax=Streptomyces TaxID=1883 RepID=UPI002F90E28F